MNLSQKLSRFGFAHDVIRAESHEIADIFAKTRRTTLVCGPKGNITAAYFRLLGSRFPIEALMPDDFASIDTVYFIRCADYALQMLKLLPASTTQICFRACGLQVFPEDLKRFKDLEKLTVTHTRIKSVPEWIANFKRLTRLCVDDNMLTGLPDRMGELTGLTALHMRSNELTGLPEWLGNLTGLTSLDVAFNRLADLPDWLGEMTGLIALDIGNNRLIDLPDWMGNLTNLTSLHVGGNELTNLPGWIGNLSNLTALDIEYISLTGLPDWMGNLTNLTSLDISGNRLADLPDWAENLTNLTSLHIGNNSLIDLPDWIGKMTNLTSLDIGFNPLTSLPDWIGNLTNLTSLDIGHNSLINLPDWVGNLTNLTSLNLRGNGLTDLPDWIGHLINLNSLYIEANSLTSLPDCLGKMTNLTALHIGFNPLTCLPDWIGNLTGLTSLYIGDNRLTGLPDWIGNLTGLTSLYIGDNQLTGLPDWIGEMTNLTALYVGNNRLTSLPDWIGKMTNLSVLTVSQNRITRLPDCFDALQALLTLDISELHLDIIPGSIARLALPFERESDCLWGRKCVGIYRTTLSQMDISLFEQSPELIEAHYQGEQIQLRECKVIFLGDGEVGKSSLIERMVSGSFDPDKKSTDGIKIIDWRPGGFDGTLRIWDFGGQEIMHSMHNCFLTSGCVYVIVLNGRENTFIDRKALHWLEVVQSFAPGSPVIIAINKSDQKPYTLIPIGKLKEKYPGIIYDSFETSAQESLNIERLRDAIMECAMQTNGYKHRFNLGMKKIKDSITGMDAFYIHSDAYKDMCRRSGIDDPETQVGLLKWFKDLGVSFYYQNKPGKEERPSMEGYTILKPDWLTNGIYRLINRAEDNNGIISHREIHEILNLPHKNDVIRDLIYSKDEAEYILYVMRLFWLSYKPDSESEDYEFIPLKCPKDMPRTAQSYKEGGGLHLSWEAEFIPYNALYQIMVEMFGEIDLQNTWRYGSVFKAANSTATVFIEMDLKEEKMDVYVKSDSGDAKDVLSRYRVHVLRTLERLGIKAEEYMHITNDKGETGEIRYTTVLNRFRDGKEVYVEGLDQDFNAAELFGIFYSKKDADHSIRIENYYQQGGSFMHENKIEAKAEGGGSVNVNAVQGSSHGTATQTISVNEPPQRVTEQQYAELIKLLNEFTQSKDFKKLGLINRQKLKKIARDGSHVSGWEKFRSFIGDAANLSAIATFAMTYGPALSAWIGNALKIAA